MSRRRPSAWLAGLAWVFASTQACYVLSDFKGLDDGHIDPGGPGAAAGADGGHGGGTGAAGAGGTSGVAGTGGVAGAGGLGGAGGGPACKEAALPCVKKEECCGNLVCTTTKTSRPQDVCCGASGESCIAGGDGADCCGMSDCDANGHCM